MKKIVLLYFLTTFATAKTVILELQYKNIVVNGKSSQVMTISNPDGTWGYYGNKGESFNVIVQNKINEPTVIHWHGLIVPNDSDGTELNQNVIAPNAQYSYNFKLVNSGTFWMHSHYNLQEAMLAEAPLIIETPQDTNYQQVVIVFQDFSFSSPDKLLQSLNKNSSAPMHMNHSMQSGSNSLADKSKTTGNMQDMDMSGMDMGHDISHISNMKMDKMDLNDIKFDAYLTNYHTVDKPQITKVKAGDTVRLRFIDGAAASNFWINLGLLKGKVIAVDGQDIKPIKGSIFPIATGQRVDILVTIPKTGGTFPILGQVEGLKSQTGIILTTKIGLKESISAYGSIVAPAVGYQLEKQLRPINHQKLVSTTGNTKNFTMVLNGDMKSYIWTINNQVWPNIKPIEVNKGDLVNVTFDNQSMMSHPMHLHGYDFKVIDINGKPIDGVFRDTVLVMPHSKVTIQFVANNPGKWMFHCHLAYHMASGMMTYLQVNEDTHTLQ